MIPIPDKITGFDESQVPVIQKIFDQISNSGLSFRYSKNVPTSDTVQANEIVVYDDGAGDKRLYIKTGKDNVGFITLT